MDKYKPGSSSELVGNPGLVNTLRQWLTYWQAVHLYGQEPPATGGSKPKDLSKKAVMMSGPPGGGGMLTVGVIACWGDRLLG